MIEALKAMQSNPNSWDVALPEIMENEQNPVVKNILKWNVIGGFCCLVDGFHIENGKSMRIKTFQEVSSDPRKVSLWNTIVSRMFFNFLETGGKDHFTFCERCGKFSVVQRKGRKRFCSDICRVYEHQEKEGKRRS